MKVESHAIVAAATWAALVAHPPAGLAAAMGAPGPGLLALSLPVAVLGALLPDLDHPGSAIAHSSILLRPVAWGAHLAFHHRGLLHSLLIVLLVGYAGSTLVASVAGFALAWGYLSHVLADFLTVQGVPLLAPLTYARFHLPVFAIRTGGLVEPAYVLLIGIGALLWALGYLG